MQGYDEPVKLKAGFHIATEDSKVFSLCEGVFVPFTVYPDQMKKLKTFLIQTYDNLPDDIVPVFYTRDEPTFEEFQKRIQTLSGK